MLCVALGLLWQPVPASAQPQPPLGVVASVHPVALLVAELGGAAVAVTTLLKPGASPHGFEVSPAQIRQLADADLFVAVGAGLDMWAERLASRVRQQLPTLVLASAVPLLAVADGHNHGEAHPVGEGDPHFWLDPIRVRDYLLPVLRDQLIEIAPRQAERLTRRAEAMAAELTNLHQTLEQTLAPYRGQGFIAFHGTWAYFAERYGLNPVGVVEPTPGREPSARWMVEVVTSARKAGAKAIIIEPQFNPRIAYTVASQFGGRVVTADPLGRPGMAGGDAYRGMMMDNAAAFQRAFAP